MRHRLYVICGSWVVFFAVFGLLYVFPIVDTDPLAIFVGLLAAVIAAPVLHVQLRVREIDK